MFLFQNQLVGFEALLRTKLTAKINAPDKAELAAALEASLHNARLSTFNGTPAIIMFIFFVRTILIIILTLPMVGNYLQTIPAASSQAFGFSRWRRLCTRRRNGQPL